MQAMIKYDVILRGIRFRVYKQNEAKEKARTAVMNEIRTDRAVLEKKMLQNLKNHPDYYL
jgi:hypothetical protein